MRWFVEWVREKRSHVYDDFSQMTAAEVLQFISRDDQLAAEFARAVVDVRQMVPGSYPRAGACFAPCFWREGGRCYYDRVALVRLEGGKPIGEDLSEQLSRRCREVCGVVGHVEELEREYFDKRDALLADYLRLMQRGSE